MSEIRGYCGECERNVLARRPDFNHTIHLLCTLFLCGAWLPIWALLALTHNPPARCSRCGSCVDASYRRASPVPLAIVFLLLCGAAVGFVGFIFLTQTH